jgi:hypothetical protein
MSESLIGTTSISADVKSLVALTPQIQVKKESAKKLKEEIAMRRAGCENLKAQRLALLPEIEILRMRVLHFNSLFARIATKKVELKQVDIETKAAARAEAWHELQSKQSELRGSIVVAEELERDEGRATDELERRAGEASEQVGRVRQCRDLLDREVQAEIVIPNGFA